MEKLIRGDNIFLWKILLKITKVNQLVYIKYRHMCIFSS